MSVIVYTNDPHGLLAAIKQAIDENLVYAWSYDNDGDFTHTAEEWKYQAWLHPSEQLDRLILNVVPPREKTVSGLVYAIYHGRFIEMLLSYFDEKFLRAVASALPTASDAVK